MYDVTARFLPFFIISTDKNEENLKHLKIQSQFAKDKICWKQRNLKHDFHFNGKSKSLAI